MKNPVPFLIAIVIIAGSVSCAGREEAPKQWWDSALGARVRVTVGPLGVERCDKPVEVPVDFNILLKQAGLNGRLDEKSVRVVETDGQGELIDEQVPFQFDRVTEVGSADDGCGTLVIMAAGISREGGKRVFEVYFDTMENAEERIAAKVEGLVSATDHVMHEGQESIMTETPSATWYYHKAGAGFASLEDSGGADWLGYRPCCESAGEYRGIPNMWEFHPGKDSCSSTVEIDGPLRARIRSRSTDGKWECVWDIFPAYARMTLCRANGTYWFLYEGTPAGTLNVDRDYNVLSTGLRRSISEDWHGDIPAPEWIYFGDESCRRVLYLVHHEDDQHSDQFWQMREEMVVFGFGRQYRCCDTYMDRVPAHFTVGFAEDSSFAAAEAVINSAYMPVPVTIGHAEARVSE